MVPLVWLLTLGGCLEKVTGEFIPLDPRYTEGHEEGGENRADPGAEHGEVAPGGGGVPWADYDGETVVVRGVVESTSGGSVQIDVAEPDASAPGGVVRRGSVALPAPGPFELKVPSTIARIELQAFQDPDVDGPSEQDPFAAASVDVASGAEVTLTLVAGARGQPSGPSGTAPEHVEAAPGAPGGSGGGAPAPPSVFPQDGPMVSLSGKVSATLEGPISIDFFKTDPTSGAGRTFLFKQEVQQGTWSAKFPVDFGQIEIDAYQDPKRDGPTEGDPITRYEKNPITVGDSDLTGIDLLIP